MFDRAALTWQWSIGLELLAGVIGMWFSLNSFSSQVDLAGAMLLLAILTAAYVLRYQTSATYADADTMRRQALLSEGMGYELGRSELLEWRNRAGPKILAKAALNPRPDDYYDNMLDENAKKLAEMTFESAHWTKCLYIHLRGYLLIVLAVSAFVVLALVSISLFDAVPETERTKLAYAAFLFAPLVLTVDFLGMVLKLNRAISELRSLSPLLEEQTKPSKPKTDSVMRLVAEYNCMVTAGVPIPNWLWRRHRKAIAESWRGKH